MMRAAALAGLLCLAAWAAEAQTSNPAPAAASPDSVAAARAEADRLIAAAHAESYFINVTSGAAPKVRHLPSGLECGFNLGQPNEIRIYQTAAKPGEDVSCATRHPLRDGGLAAETLFASRYPQTPTLQQAMAAVVDSIRVRSPEAKAAGGRFNNLTLGGAGGISPPHAAVRLELAPDGRRLFSRAAVGVVRGWVVSQRVTAPIDDADSADTIGELGMALAVLAVQRATVDEADLARRQIAGQDTALDEAHRLLKSVRDQEAFTNLTTGGVARLQHKASGVICRFGREPAVNRLALLPAGFACNSARDFGAETLEVTYLPGVTKADVALLVGKFISAQYPGAEPLTGFGDARATDGAGRPLPDHLNQRFAAATKTGVKLFVRVSSATVGDWMIVQRILGSPDNARLVDLSAERDMIGYVGQLAGKQDLAPRIGLPTKQR